MFSDGVCEKALEDLLIRSHKHAQDDPEAVFW